MEYIETKARVKLDGKFIFFRSVSVTMDRSSNISQSCLDIRLVLLDGGVINDNGSRVEVFEYADADELLKVLEG